MQVHGSQVSLEQVDMVPHADKSRGWLGFWSHDVGIEHTGPLVAKERCGSRIAGN